MLRLSKAFNGQLAGRMLHVCTVLARAPQNIALAPNPTQSPNQHATHHTLFVACIRSCKSFIMRHTALSSCRGDAKSCIADDQAGPIRRQAIVADPNCLMRAQNCNLQTVTLVLIICIGALLILYTLIWFGYMWRAFRDLRKHQYMHYKMGNLIVRMQVHIAHTAGKCVPFEK